MEVRLLFFAHYRDLAGAGEATVHIADGGTVADAVAAVRGRGAGWARLPPNPAVAVNHEYASLDTPLRDGDEVALLPPVAGG